MKSLTIILGVLLVSMATFAQEVKQDMQPESKHDMKQEHKGHDFALKELDEFHDLLHPLVHDAYENGDFETIRAGLGDLVPKAVAIEKVKLPKKYDSRKKEFQKQAKLLVSQVKDLAQIKDKVDDEILGSKFDEMHETFEHLAGLLMK